MENIKIFKKISFGKKLATIAGLAVIVFIVYKQQILFYATKEKQPTFTAGMISGWPPYMSIDKYGKYEGFDVDVAQEVAQRMKLKLKIKDLGALAPLLLSLEKSKIDVAFSGLDITQKRKEDHTMIQYRDTNIDSFYMLFWNEIPKDITCIEDFCSCEKNTLCVEPDSSSEKFLLQTHLKGLTQKPIDRKMDVILELKFGKSNAAIYEPIAARDLINKYPEIKMIKIPIPPEFMIKGTGVAIKKNNINLTQQVNQIIKSMKKDGTLTELEKKWNLNELST